MKEACVYLATIADQVERYDDMTNVMKEAAKLGIELNFNEIILLNGAYKHVTGALRKSWHKISSIEEEEKRKSNNEPNMKLSLLKAYRRKVELELTKTCIDILTITDGLLPSARSAECIVFYYKMKGDYRRYLAEFRTGTEGEEAGNESLKAYESASNTADTALEPSHRLRLGLALNIATLYHGVLDSPDQAIQVAKKALEAIADIDVVRESSDDATFLIDHLKAYAVRSTGSEDVKVDL